MNRNAATAEAGGFPSGKQATEAMEGASRKKREAQADPTFLEGPAGPEASAEGTVTGNRQVRLKGARREPTGVARPRPEPETPQGACSHGVRPAWERRQALTGAAVRTRDKWGLMATSAPILIPGPRGRSVPDRAAGRFAGLHATPHLLVISESSRRKPGPMNTRSRNRVTPSDRHFAASVHRSRLSPG
jgi:hypothetical protein